MKFRKNANLIRLIEAVKKCSGDVYFNSAEGDHLNLASTLSQFLFAAVCEDKEFLREGDVVCDNAADYEKLLPFLEEDHH